MMAHAPVHLIEPAHLLVHIDFDVLKRLRSIDVTNAAAKLSVGRRNLYCTPL